MAFVTITRLASKRLLGGLQQPFFKTNVPAISASTIAMQDSLPKEGETHDQKNARLHRPMSPHLTVYKYETTMIFSITHRLTGCALSAYAIALGCGALCMSHDFEHYVALIEAWQPSTWMIVTGKFMLAFPLMYHTCNGLRHLMWDTGRQLNKRAVVTTGSVMLTASVITTIMMMCL